MSRYEFYMPSTFSEAVQRGRERYAALYAGAVRDDSAFRWAADLFLLPGTPAGETVRALPGAAFDSVS